MTLDQNEYAKTLRTIAHKDFVGQKPEELASSEAHSLYRSLLGAVAYLTRMRIDIAVFAAALHARLSTPCAAFFLVL